MSNQVPVLDREASRPDNLLNDVEANVTASFSRASAEMEAVFHEGLELERQGKLDADATRRIEARLQSISDKLDKTAADHIADIKAQLPTRPHFGIWQKIAVAFFFFALVSVPLEFTLGERFVFSAANTYRAAVPLLFAVLVPAFAIFWFRLERKQHNLAFRYPTWLVRWLLMFPLIVVTSAAMVIFSPFGWSALAGWAIGTPSAQKTAKVLSVEPMREPRRVGKCDQKANFRIDEIQANICIEGLVVGPTPKPGDSITVVGRNSPFGFFIEEVRVK
jgi:hypothetical protein